MGELAQELFDLIGDQIEKMPSDGKTADGGFSPNLKREQRIFIEGIRYARFRACKFVDDTMEQS